MIAEPGCSIEAILLSKSDCLLCHEAEAMLNDLAAEYPLVITVIDAESPLGSELMQRFLLLFTPALVLGGEPFGYGRLSERALRQAIERQLSPDALIDQRFRTPAGRVRQALTQFLNRSI